MYIILEILSLDGNENKSKDSICMFGEINNKKFKVSIKWLIKSQ